MACSNSEWQPEEARTTACLQVLGWAQKRGPLVLPLTQLQFLLVYAFPITPATGRTQWKCHTAGTGGMHRLQPSECAMPSPV